MKDTCKSKIISELYELVETACRSTNNKYGYGIWSHHILDVVKFGKELSRIYGADEEVVEIAALLHDYAGIADSANRENHHIAGAAEAGKLLSGYGFPKERIGMVKKCILNHRSSVGNSKNTPEEICVASADAIAHINQVASLFYVSYRELEMDIDRGREWVREKIERDWTKLCAYGKEMIEEKYKAIMILSGK